MEDQYALKPALWQTSLFRLQNVKLMMTTYNNLLMLESSRWSTYQMIILEIMSMATFLSSHKKHKI